MGAKLGQKMTQVEIQGLTIFPVVQLKTVKNSHKSLHLRITMDLIIPQVFMYYSQSRTTATSK